MNKKPDLMYEIDTASTSSDSDILSLVLLVLYMVRGVDVKLIVANIYSK